MDGGISIQAIQRYTEDVFPAFGVNKKQEISRLLFEIIRRDGCHLQSVLPEAIKHSDSFRQVKAFLTKRRYPNMTAVRRKSLQRFLKIPEPCRMQGAGPVGRRWEPKKVFVEEPLMTD
ncbi:MAG TPA: hypothetical protein PKU74_05075, partial [Candidatus Omnitrophota bacterium]|nr:hypothetical protein [Candidatus Omnitrophota bacterium]